MSVSIKEYFALAGSRFTNDDARVIGPVLQELADEGDVTAAQVVAAAHSSNSPLHGYFEWNDKVAAGHYREQQANEMIKCVKVRVVRNGEEYAHRAFRIKVQGRPADRERHTSKSFKGDTALNTAAAEAIRELDAWRLKYQHCAADFDKVGAALQVVMNQIGEFKEDFATGGLDARAASALEELNDWRARYQRDAEATSLFGEHVRYMVEAIESACSEAGEALRATAGIRKCLGCGRNFESEHAGNRLCDACKRTDTVYELRGL